MTKMNKSFWSVLTMLAFMVSHFVMGHQESKNNNFHAFKPDDYPCFLNALNSNNTWLFPFGQNSSLMDPESMLTDNCLAPTPLTVNPDNTCSTVRNVTFWFYTPSPEPNPCVENNGRDIWFSFTAIDEIHNITLSNYSHPGNPLPLVLTLYSGSCGNLTALACGDPNISVDDLTPGETYLVRLTVDSTDTSLNYFQTVDICVNTGSSGGDEDCIVETINPDFELPALTGSAQWPTFVNHNVVPGWLTTAPDQMIEIWRTGNYENVPAYSGTQFIELNANFAADVYQDFATPYPMEFNYSFAHRGRLGVDACQLQAGPPGGPYTVVRQVSTGTSWQEYTGIYEVPVGQTSTRFIFNAHTTSSGDPTVGNFLDAISFSANNGISSETPIHLDCNDDVATGIVAEGGGMWIIDPDNPSPTVIDDVYSNTPEISGFSVPGTYYYYWDSYYCEATLEVIYSEDPLPVNSSEYTLPDVCEDSLPIDLTQYEPDYTDITGAEGYGNYYPSIEDLENNTNVIPNPDQYSPEPGEATVYVKLTHPDYCESIIAIHYHVDESVNLLSAETDYYQCSEDGTVVFDLYFILGDLVDDFVAYSPVFYVSGSETPIDDPGAYPSSGGETIQVVFTNGQCDAEAFIHLHVYTINTIEDISLCDEAGVYTYDLTTLTTLLTGVTGAAFEFSVDADFTTIIPELSWENYIIPSLPFTLYVRVIFYDGNGLAACSLETEVLFTAGDSLPVNSNEYTLSDVCEDSLPIDLTQYEPDYTDLTGAEGYGNYYPSLEDLENNTNVIPNPDQYGPETNDGTVYVKLTHPDYCESIIAIHYHIDESVDLLSAETDYYQCSEDGTVVFDLYFILGDLVDDFVAYSPVFYVSGSETPIDDPGAYPSSGSETIRVVFTNGQCDAEAFIHLHVYTINTIEDISLCDEAGVYTYDLTTLTTLLTGVGGVVFEFSSDPDFTTIIPESSWSNYNISTLPFTLYVRVVFPDGSGGEACSLVSEITFVQGDSLPVNNDGIFILPDVCEDSLPVDLTQYEPDYTDLTGAEGYGNYYPSIEDLENNINMIPNPEQYSPEMNDGTVYVKLTHPDYCESIIAIHYHIDESVDLLSAETDYYQCSEDETAVFDLYSVLGNLVNDYTIYNPVFYVSGFGTPIDNPDAYPSSGGETVQVVFSNGTCSVEAVINLHIYTLDAVEDISLCDEAGVYTYDLTTLTTLLTGVTGATFEFSADADFTTTIPESSWGDYIIPSLPFTLYVRVAFYDGNGVAACSLDTAVLFIAGDLLPVNSSEYTLPEACEDELPIDLTEYESDYTDLTGVIYTYYPSLEDLENNTNVIPNSDQYNPETNDGTIYVKLTHPDYCESIIAIHYHIDESVDLLDTAIDYYQCSEDGTAVFDLYSVLGNLVEDYTIYNPVFYVSGSGIPIDNPDAYPSSGGETVQVVFSNGTCSVEAVINLHIYTLDAVEDIPLCDEAGVYTYDLTTLTALLTGVTGVTFEFSADTDFTTIIPESSWGDYIIPSLPFTLYVRVTFYDGNGVAACSLESTVIFTAGAPVPVNSSEYTLPDACEADLPIDLTQYEPDYTDLAGVTYIYYPSLDDLENGTGVITDPESYIPDDNEGTVYVHLTHPDYCESIIAIHYHIDESVDLLSAETDYYQCSEDGTAVFDLYSVLGDLVNDYTIYNPVFYVFGFGIPIDNPDAYPSSGGETVQVVFSNGTCSVEAVINLHIYTLDAVEDIPLCDEDGDGIYVYDLSSLTTLLTGVSGAAFEFSSDPDFMIIIPESSWEDYTIPGLPFALYIRVTFPDGSGGTACSLVSTVTFVSGVPVPVNRDEYFLTDICEDELPIDLTEYESDYTDLTGVTYTYYPSIEDLENGTGLIANTQAYTPTDNGGTVYVKLSLTGYCSSIIELHYTINPNPSVNLPDTFEICPVDEPIVVDDPDAYDQNYTFLWEWDGGSQDELALTVTQAGVYTLTVTNDYGCTYQHVLTVTEPDTPTIVQVLYENETLTVLAYAGGGGVLEYSLDGINWQTSNVFYNITVPNQYTIYVREDGCQIVTTIFNMVIIPNFISPNGDGSNDVFVILGVPLDAGAVIKIFDRYGKVLVSKQIEDIHVWDGKYLGSPVPSTTYWYILEIPAGEFQEKTVYKGMVTVKNY